MNINPEVKANWLIALRSGQYQQARANLYELDVNGNALHCCLAVLCELYRQEHAGHWQILSSPHGPGDYAFIDVKGHDSAGSILSQDVREWADIRSMTTLHLAELNDGAPNKDIEPHDFLQIADYIEVNL